MNHNSTHHATPLFPALTSAEFEALVALATRRSIETGPADTMSGFGPGTASYVEHRLVLLGLAMRVADSDNGSRSVLVLSTAGRILVNDVHERDYSSVREPAIGERVVHDFSQWSIRPRRDRRQPAGPQSS